MPDVVSLSVSLTILWPEFKLVMNYTVMFSLVLYLTFDFSPIQIRFFTFCLLHVAHNFSFDCVPIFYIK